jgi:hypothetical protein
MGEGRSVLRQACPGLEFEPLKSIKPRLIGLEPRPVGFSIITNKQLALSRVANLRLAEIQHSLINVTLITALIDKQFLRYFLGDKLTIDQGRG